MDTQGVPNFISKHQLELCEKNTYKRLQISVDQAALLVITKFFSKLLFFCKRFCCTDNNQKGAPVVLCHAILDNLIENDL